MVGLFNGDRHSGDRGKQMKLKCNHCGSLNETDADQEQKIAKALQIGWTSLPFICSNCKRQYIGEFTKQDNQTSQNHFRCPVSHCAGWISYIEQDGHCVYACGECGSFWKEKNILFNEIIEITAKFPYRKKSYRFSSNGDITPVPLENEETSYEEQVETEPFDSLNVYERG